MYYTRNRSFTAVVDIGHGSRNSTSSRNSTKEWHYHIGHTLCNEFGIGVVLVAYHTISHHSRKERFDSTEHCNSECCGEETLYQTP